MIARRTGDGWGLIVSPADVEALTERARRWASLTDETIARAAAYLEAREQARRFYYPGNDTKIVKLPFRHPTAAPAPNAPARGAQTVRFISENITLQK